MSGCRRFSLNRRSIGGFYDVLRVESVLLFNSKGQGTAKVVTKASKTVFGILACHWNLERPKFEQIKFMASQKLRQLNFKKGRILWRDYTRPKAKVGSFCARPNQDRQNGRGDRLQLRFSKQKFTGHVFVLGKHPKALGIWRFSGLFGFF